MSDPEPFDDFEGDGEDLGLDDHESALIEQDLVDLGHFETTFRAEGYRGVSVFCQDCVEEHYYPWDMLRENLTTLLETGETPVHEPAFAPDPEQYIPWEYARGYVDALQDVGVDERLDVGTCPRCGYSLTDEFEQGNYCPRCGMPLLQARLRQALTAAGMDDADVEATMRRAGLPG